MRRGVTVDSSFAGPMPRDYKPSARARVAYAEHLRLCLEYRIAPQEEQRYCWEFDLCGDHESERGVRPRYEPSRESSLAEAIRMMSSDDSRMNWSGRPKKIPGKRGPKPKAAKKEWEDQD